MKVFVLLDDCTTFIDKEDVMNTSIYIPKTKYSNNYASLMVAFIDFASKYEALVDDLNADPDIDPDTVLFIHTDLMSICEKCCDGTSLKEVHSWLSQSYKNMKLIGFTRPDRFIILSHNEESDIEGYMFDQVLESGDGDNILIKYTDADDRNKKLDELYTKLIG